MNILSLMNKHAHWALRIGLSSVFVYHGVTKFPVLESMAEMLGMSVAALFILAIVETLGGLLILVGGVSKGIFTRIGSLLLIPIMLGAIVKAHWGQWSFVPSETHPMGGIEFQVTLTLISLYLFIKGNDFSSKQVR